MAERVDTEPEAPYRKSTRRLALASIAVTGASALAFEVVWSRELSVIFGSTVYAVSLMLATFMAGLSIGSFYAGRRVDRTTRPLALLAWLDVGAAAAGLLTLVLMRALPSVYFLLWKGLQPSFGMFLLIQGVLSFVVMLAPTVLLGAMFPVVSRICTPSADEVGADVGTVYSVNTFGSILGSLAAGFLLIPLIGLTATAVAAALACVLIATIIAYRLRQAPRRKLMLAACAAVTVLGVVVGVAGEPAIQLGFYNMSQFDSLAEFGRHRARLAIEFSETTPQGRVVVAEDPSGTRHLYQSGANEGSSMAGDVLYNRIIGLLPAVVHGGVERGLVVGLGTGQTTLGLLAANPKQVDTVDINPAMRNASQLFVGRSLEDDPRWSFHVGDGRNFVARSEQPYDAIVSHPSYPLSKYVGPLYTKEYFQLARGRLTEGGVYSQWLPRYLVTREDFMMVYKTMSSVFDEVHVWQLKEGEQISDLFLVGIVGEVAVDPEGVAAEVKRRLDSPAWAGFTLEPLGAPETIAAALADPSVPLNTDDRPIFEFRAARNWYEMILGDNPS